MAYNKKKIPREVRWLGDRLERFERILENYKMDNTGLLEEGKDHIEKVKETVKRYNTILREADKLRDELDQQVGTARDIHDRLRMKVVAACGRDSAEYEQLGGMRTSDIDYSRKEDSSDDEEQ